ncbi:MAG: InlB B-repeat-containing protein [Bacteroidales bacterium]|nr:InlB B-repeat-containing protein [Bacteroidales bacterium]
MTRQFLALFLLTAISTTALAQNTSRVYFDLNYDTEEAIAPITVKTGCMIPLAAKQFPTRQGYRFGGWYTTPDCLPEQEWRFGNNASFPLMPATDSMKVEKSMILYAKWVFPKPVRTAEELDAIRKDLDGWYVLEEDVDLSGIANWIPIGEYEGNYEFAPGEWWRHAFKGILDGNGHTIRGLRITELTTDKSGLFGTVANGEILNLNMEDSRLVFTAERPYVAPLAGILKQDDDRVCIVRNCTVTGTLIQVKTTNEAGTFHSFTGLCGGAWGGTLENITVTGKMDIEIAGTGGGELYVGAYLGEAYNDTKSCTSDFDIAIRFSKPQPETGFKAFIGGLQASATYVDACTAHGHIRVSGETGGKQLFIGGLIGSERYGTVSNSASDVKVEVSNTGFAQVGGIVGEFNEGYGAIGSAFGVRTTVVKDCSYTGKPKFRKVAEPVFNPASGGGEPKPLASPWGLSMGYQIENCTYKTR